MFLSVLTKDLDWESLTTNLVTFSFNIMGFRRKILCFYGGRVTQTKRGVWTVCRFKGTREPGKKEGVVFPHLGRQGACHDNIKSEDPQTKKIFRQ